MARASAASLATAKSSTQTKSNTRAKLPGNLPSPIQPSASEILEPLMKHGLNTDQKGNWRPRRSLLQCPRPGPHDVNSRPASDPRPLADPENREKDLTPRSPDPAKPCGEGSAEHRGRVHSDSKSSGALDKQRADSPVQQVAAPHIDSLYLLLSVILGDSWLAMAWACSMVPPFSR